jgi:CRISPR-associated protein Csm2
LIQKNDKKFYTKGFFANAVSGGINNNFIEDAKIFGDFIHNDVTTTQIRNVFGSVKKMEVKGLLDLSGLLLLKPKIEYANKRANKKRFREFADELIEAIDSVEKAEIKKREQCFKNFCKGFEAIIAYHRASGGK